MATPTSLRKRARGQSPTLVLLERLGIVLLAALLTGVFLAFAGLVNVSIQVWALNLATAAGLGLVSGLASRLALRRYRWTLRLTAALAAAVVSMIFVGWLTWGFAGITPQLAPRTGIDWVGLARVAIGILGAALALRAWSPTAGRGSVAPPIREAEPPAMPGSFAPTNEGPSRQRIRGASPGLGPALPSSAIRLPLRPRLKGLGSAWAARLAVLRRRAFPVQPAGIRLTGAEEHRCPYCLGIVTPGDPRGVVVCPVCHTQHHADCWAITGVCQVPHHHA